MSDKPSFFAELKRRHVYKVAVAYAIVGWLVMQVAATVVPALHLSDSITSAVVVLVILGFPIALILAWAFELTPEGIKRTESADQLPRKSSHGRVWIYIVVIAAAFSVSLFFLGRFTISSKQSGPAEAPSKSIAVLPFESLSEDKNNAYFADGIQDEILARLSKIADLKVISRTSTQKYKSAPDNLREIAEKLGVANILEGSVQKSNDQVRVTVQLINALNDSHLWAETYDRKLIDVFGVESDVAQKIAGSLEAKLTGRERAEITFAGTKNPDAYDALLHALAFNSTAFFNGADLEKQIDYCRRAVELDPNYADAWALLAAAQVDKFQSPWQSEELAKSVLSAAETALRLAPDSARAHEAMGLYYRYCQKDIGAALREFEIARERAPNDGRILADLGVLQRAQGKINDALVTLRKAAELDPLTVSVWSDLAWTYAGLRRFDEARSTQDRALAVSPDNIVVIAYKGASYQAEGNLEAAWKLMGSHPFPPATDYAFVPYHDQYYLWRDYGTLIEIINKMDLPHKNIPPILTAATDAILANLYFLNGQRDMALPYMQRAEHEMRDLRARNLGLVDVSGVYIESAARFENREEVERAVEYDFAETRDNQWLFPGSEYSAAVGYTLLGDFDRALPFLQDALSRPNANYITPAYLRLSPVWDGVRNDLRFQKLLISKP
jgi:TolB-like protein/cytochrome c-type biogenesis protein CcmH/NrfG